MIDHNDVANNYMEIHKDYIESFLMEDDLLSLTPVGWALVNLGNVYDDKASIAKRIALGMSIYRYGKPDKVDNEYQYVSARALLNDMNMKGHTNRMMGVDVVTSGIHIMASLYGCKKTLNTVMGKPMSAYEAFYTPPPDTYTGILDIANKLLGSTSENSISRKLFKKAFIPRIYGSGERTITNVFGENTIESQAVLKAESMAVPVLELHKKTFMSIDFSDRKYAEWIDFLGRKISLPITVDNQTTMKTPYGNLNIHHSEFSTPENDVYHGSFLPILAHVIHNFDSNLVVLAHKQAKKHNYIVKDIHDDIHTTPDRINNIRKLERDIRVKAVEADYLNNVFNQLGGVTFPEVDKEFAINHIMNTHLFMS